MARMKVFENPALYEDTGGRGFWGLKSEFTTTAYKTYGPKLREMCESEMLVKLNKISARNSLILQH